MSLKKIGKFNNATRLFNGVSTREDVVSLATALAASGNASKGVNWITKYGKNLDSGVAYQAMVKAFGKENITEDMMAKIGYTAGGAGKVGDVAIGAGLLGSLKDTGSGLLAFIKPLLPILGIAGAIGVGTLAWKGLDNQFDLTKATTTKKYQKAQKKNETAQSDLETAQSAYETNQDRIQELRVKENRSLEESQELNNLQDQNELLGAQVSLKQRLADSAKTAEANAAQKDLNKKSMQQDYFSDGSGNYNPQAKVYVNDLDEAQAKMDYIQHLQDRYDTAYENIKKGHGGNIDLITEEENKTLEKQQEGIDNQKSELSEMISNISDQSQSMLKDDGTVLDKKYQGTIDQVNSLIDNYSNLIGSSSDTEDKPSIASMNEFTDMMTGNNGAKLNNVPSVQNQNITFNPEINLNVDRIDSELDIKNLAHQLSGIMFDDFTKKMSKDWKKLTGRNR